MLHGFIWLVIIASVVGLGYMGFSGLDSSTEATYMATNEQTEINQNPIPANTETDITEEEIPDFLEPPTPEEVNIPDDIVVEDDTPKQATVDDVPPEHKELAIKIERLITDNIFMKVGSRGTRVGTVQEFLNVFTDKNSLVDNDYGNGTKQAVLSFQEKAGLAADGLAGPATYQAMINWLADPV